MSNKIFDWEEYKNNEKIVVHCNTRLEAIDFALRIQEVRFGPNKYPSFDSRRAYENFIGTCWSLSEEDFCITFQGIHSSINYFRNHNYTILEYDDYFEVKKEVRERNESLLDEEESYFI